MSHQVIAALEEEISGYRAVIERLRGDLDCCSKHSTNQARVVRDLRSRLEGAILRLRCIPSLDSFSQGEVDEVIAKLRGEES